MKTENIFEQWLKPLSLETFQQDYLDQKFLHHASKRGKKAIDWINLNRLLEQSAFWTCDNFKLYFNKEPVPITQYCTQVPSHQGQMIYRPHPPAVQHWLSQGGSLVLNDVESLVPDIKRLAGCLRQTFGGQIQANLYASMNAIPAFDSHFDVHDVFVFQAEGQKVWRLYAQRFEAPIAHPKFDQFTQAQHDQAKGALLAEITLRPGDFLYIPRGFYHDALATQGPSMHVTLGLARPIGLDLISLLFEAALDHASFRHYLNPHNLPKNCGVLMNHLAEIIKEDTFQTKVQQLFQTEQEVSLYSLPHFKK
ncbi:MAG: JmjC domain-containing protein [Janthinobacterium lividum]